MTDSLLLKVSEAAALVMRRMLIGTAQVLREVDVATDSVADVILTPVMTIGRTNSTTRTGAAFWELC